MLLGVLEPVNNAGCDDRVLNSLIRLLFEILCEEGVRLNRRSNAQQLLHGRTIRVVHEIATRDNAPYEPHE